MLHLIKVLSIAFITISVAVMVVAVAIWAWQGALTGSSGDAAYPLGKRMVIRLKRDPWEVVIGFGLALFWTVGAIVLPIIGLLEAFLEVK